MAIQATVDAKPTREEIEAEINAARDRLADHIADLASVVHPRAVARNATGAARTAFSGGMRGLKNQFIDENGLRASRVALIGASVAGIAVFALVVRSIAQDR